MKATATSPANLAFIKYWGNKNHKLRIPNNNSLSMNLSGIETTTTVEFDPDLENDQLILNEQAITGKGLERAQTILDWVRKKADIKFKARINSENTFPTGTGIASSASGFSALATAAAAAVSLDLNDRELSSLARLGSGSASRSIPDGIVEWQAGHDHESSYAESLYDVDYWKLHDLVVIVDREHKKVGSTQGHGLADTSPMYQGRLDSLPERIAKLKKALTDKDFTTFGEICEADSLSLHAVMMTSEPYVLYWMPGTIDVMQSVAKWREDGLESYFSLDAGANVHVLCQPKDVDELKKRLTNLRGVQEILVSQVGPGARVVNSD